MKVSTVHLLTCLIVLAIALPGVAEQIEIPDSAEQTEKAYIVEKAAIVLENNESIHFKNVGGVIDGTEIRRFGGNALRFRYGGNVAIFDSLDNLPFQIRNTAGAVVFSVDPDSHAFFTNSGSLGIGVSPSANVKVDILSSNGTGTGIRFRRTDAKDARIQVGDPTRTWSMAVGWATGGDFSILEEGVAGDRLYIKQGGNVGIGTTNPTERFEVIGNIKLSGSIVSNGDICIGSGCP